MSTLIGYITLARRPDNYRPGEFDTQPVGSIWPTREPADNHRFYCEMKYLDENGRTGVDKFGNPVEYIVGVVHEWPEAEDDE